MPAHTYGVGVIRLFLQFVLDAACSLRASSAVLGVLEEMWPALERSPVANTGQSWLLRIGLYELIRPKEKAEDWVWIVDHTVQIGVTKCLAIVGCRLSVWQAERRPLEHHDLHVLALEPVEGSDGETVYRQLEETCRKMGSVPRAILSDEGTDLKGGIQAFCGVHKKTTHSLDIAHQAAKLLKRELERDTRWGEFMSQAGSAKQRLAQTPLAHLLPPTPRSKARYMNLEEIVAWGGKALGYLDNPLPVAGQPLDIDALRAKLGWLANYRHALAEWSQVMATIATTLDYVRREGYHLGAAGELELRLLALKADAPMSLRLAEGLLNFVRSQSAAARDNERLIGSSECLESLLGKGKRLEGQQSKSGFTKMILGIAASAVRLTPEYISTALECVKNADLLNWCRQSLGISVQSKRQKAFAAVGTNPG